jgi:hypothetical protein
VLFVCEDQRRRREEEKKEEKELVLFCSKLLRKEEYAGWGIPSVSWSWMR